MSLQNSFSGFAWLQCLVTDAFVDLAVKNDMIIEVVFCLYRSTLSETPNSKASLSSPRISRSTSKGVAKSDADSASPLQSARLSVDRSPRSVTSKPPIERPSPKLGVGVGGNPPYKKTSRLSKPSELQSELSLAQEDLKKAKEMFGLLEKEKEKFFDELKETHKLADEANEKLKEALLAQKRAEENSEIEKFRAVEMEQAGIEAAQKKEDEWQKELEAIRNQHALDVAALLSATEELHKVKKELDMAGDAKNKALGHAEDATKLAEIHADKVEALSAELVHLKSLLDSKLKMEDSENDKFVTELSLEVDSLRQELKMVKIFEEKLEEREAALEHLSVDLEAAKMAESYAHNLVEELHYRVEKLSAQAEQAKRLERSASESLESVMKQLEVSNDSLQDSQSEISSLREKVGLLEFSIRRQKVDLEESERRLELVKEEASVMTKKVESIQFELESLKEEKIQALSNEKLAADSVQTLLEEKHKLINELENSRDEEEKTKKALESLASALHEVSAEARDVKEKLLSVEVERENYETQIEHLKLALKATNEKCESMLNDAKQEIDILKNAIEHSKSDHQKLTAEWEQKELHLMNSVKKYVEDSSSMEGEINRLVNLLKMAEVEACAVKEEEERWKDTFKEAESEIISLKDVLGQTKDESMRLKEVLMDRENEIQNILQENEELRNREAASVIKAEELSKLLEEALAKKQILENGELTDSEKDYDMLPKVVEFFEQNGTGNVKKPNKNSNDEASVTENLNGKHMENDMSEEVDIKMWESCKIDEKDLSPEGETEHEVFEDEPAAKADGYDQVNGLSSLSENLDDGGTSPSKQQNQKKKKPLLQKFGGLLKKRSPSSHK